MHTSASIAAFRREPSLSQEVAYLSRREGRGSADFGAPPRPSAPRARLAAFLRRLRG